MRIALLVVLLVAGPALAQTGPALMIKPFAEGQTVEGWSSVMLLEDGETTDQSPDVDVDLVIVDAAGRWRITGEDQRNITVGAAITDINISTNFAMLPDDFTDQSFAVGFNVGQWQDWQIDAVAGFGYAGSNAYDDADGLYAMADLIFTKELDENSQLQFMIDYNGNRTIWPDLPLPAIAYSHKVDDTLSYTVGVPFSHITWKPAAGWTIDLDYAVPFNFGVKADYQLMEGLHVFGMYDKRIEAFVFDDDKEHRRFFFEQSRLEGGVRWEPCANFGVEVAGGYAFGMEFERGFDVRDTSNIVELEDEPYLRVAIDVEF